MKYFMLHCPWLKVNGMALFPFVLIKEKQMMNNTILLQHEEIHLRQQLELLILPFYALYILHYLINLCLYQQHDKAYRNIIFEKEAYANDEKAGFLQKRRLWNFLKYA